MDAAKKRGGYLTQCDGGGRGSPCEYGTTTRLPKPKAWRCVQCTDDYGPLKETR